MKKLKHAKAEKLNEEATTQAPAEAQGVPAVPEARPATAGRPHLVRVRVKQQALNEGGFRGPGEVFEISAVRRAALGGLVEDVAT